LPLLGIEPQVSSLLPIAAPIPCILDFIVCVLLCMTMCCYYMAVNTNFKRIIHYYCININSTVELIKIN
jgi:hypothetical protein